MKKIILAVLINLILISSAWAGVVNFLPNRFSGLSIDDQLLISDTGYFNQTYTFAGVTVTPQILLESDSNARYAAIAHSNTSTRGPFYVMGRSRGTQLVPLQVQEGDLLGSFFGMGYDSVDYASAAGIRFESDGSVSTTSMPGSIKFQTVPKGSTSLATRAIIDNLGTFALFAGSTVTNIDASSEQEIMSIDGSAARTWDAGAISVQRSFRFINPEELNAAGSSNISILMGLEVDGIPQVGTNMTASTSFGTFFGDINDTKNDVAGNGGMVAITHPSLTSGIGATDYMAGLTVLSLNNDTTIGNQNATTSQWAGVLITSTNLVSDAATRTISTAYGLDVAAPTQGTNVSLTASGAIKANGNISIQNNGVLQRATTSLTAAQLLTFQGGNVIFISGTTTIESIASSVNYPEGTEVDLIFSASVTVTNNSTGGGGQAILLAGGSNFSATANDVLTLVKSNTSAWVEKSRSVN